MQVVNGHEVVVGERVGLGGGIAGVDGGSAGEPREGGEDAGVGGEVIAREREPIAVAFEADDGVDVAAPSELGIAKGGIGAVGIVAEADAVFDDRGGVDAEVPGGGDLVDAAIVVAGDEGPFDAVA